jgi:hypothetical protein
MGGGRIPPVYLRDERGGNVGYTPTCFSQYIHTS